MEILLEVFYHGSNSFHHTTATTPIVKPGVVGRKCFFEEITFSH
ncbi:hypothetical protein Nmel_008586 [Mimus melanotis]